MATAVKYTMPSTKVEDVLANIEDDLLATWLKPSDRDLACTLEVILTTAVEDGDVVIVNRPVATTMFRLGWADHTDFVGGVECPDCRGTFFLRKNGTHCPECGGLL